MYNTLSVQLQFSWWPLLRTTVKVRRRTGCCWLWRHIVRLAGACDRCGAALFAQALCAHSEFVERLFNQINFNRLKSKNQPPNNRITCKLSVHANTKFQVKYNHSKNRHSFTPQVLLLHPLPDRKHEYCGRMIWIKCFRLIKLWIFATFSLCRWLAFTPRILFS